MVCVLMNRGMLSVGTAHISENLWETASGNNPVCEKWLVRADFLYFIRKRFVIL